MRQYIYGKNTVYEALKGDKPVYEIYLMKNVKEDKIIELAKKKNAKVNIVTQKSVFNDLVGKAVHQGIVASVDGYKYYTIDEIVKSIPQGKMPLLLMLDGLEDP